MSGHRRSWSLALALALVVLMPPPTAAANEDRFQARAVVKSDGADLTVTLEVMPEPGRGRATLLITYRNDGAWTSGSTTDVTMRLFYPSSVTVVVADPVGYYTKEGGQYGWRIDPIRRGDQPRKVAVILAVSPGYSANQGVDVRFIEAGIAGYEQIGGIFPLDLDQCEKLTLAAVAPAADIPEPSAMPTLPPATLSLTPIQTLTNSETVASTPDDIQESPPPAEALAPSPEPAGSEQPKAPQGRGLLLIGVTLVMVVALVALLWTQWRRRRARAEPFLVSVSGPTRRYAVTSRRFTIGRAVDNNLVINESFPNWATVSRHHAVISWQGDRVMIEDRDSQNGIKVNDQPTLTHRLQDGCKVAIGAEEFIFQTTGPTRSGRRAVGL